ALSGDGNTLAVGAYQESSNATGINGDQANNAASQSGVVYVFTRSASTWSQQAYVKASNTGAGDNFGRSVALSGDGNTLAVGAYAEDSNATGVNAVGGQANNSASDSGAVYVFTRSASTWSQQAYVKASNTGVDDNFGYSVALSGDGNTLAVGAWREDSNAIGINNDETNNSATDSGAVYVFTRSASTWSQQAYVKASNTGAGDNFGWSVALSGDGNTLAVGAWREDSNAIGINNDETNNSATNSGAVYVFTRSASTWSQQAYVKASNTEAVDLFGWSVALSSDGNTLAVGAHWEDSNAQGIGSDQGDNSANNSGAVYVFTRIGGTWSQQAYVKASNTGAYDLFSYRVALSSDGNTLAVGAWGEDSSATGVNAGGGQTDNAAGDSGAVYVFTRSASTWSQQAYVKASNTGGGNYFGISVALSGDGNTLAVGAYGEDSNATGINAVGGQANNAASNAGAVYVY
uniref:FG-GAP repeat protein n=1 Tax=Acidovorax sp. TaxID=1872122 RepID=UPI0026385EFA